MEEIECDEKGLVVEYMKKQSPPPFLVKTYMLVEDPATDEVISWNEDGNGFVVWETADFSRDLLPTLFKHSNFSSFVRQLNTYGFRKVATSRWEFSNDMFRKGEKELLSQIRRKKAWSTSSSKHQPPPSKEYCDDHEQEHQRYSSSATSSSSEYSSLIDENKRLKKENSLLTSQLSSMKMKCKELLDLVSISNHTVAEKDQLNDDDDDDEEEDKEEEENEIERRPKLFGVRLECQEVIMERKRKRSNDVNQSVGVFLSQPCK